MVKINLASESPFGVSCHKKIPIELKLRVYCTVVRLASLYNLEYWPPKRLQVQRLMAKRWRLNSHRRSYRIKNEVTREKV